MHQHFDEQGSIMEIRIGDTFLHLGVVHVVVSGPETIGGATWWTLQQPFGRSVVVAEAALTDQRVWAPVRSSADLPDARDIGWAVAQMRSGRAVRRAGWNGKGMWLRLQVPDANSKMSLPYVYMRTADAKLVPWLCSQSDLLSTDWGIAADAEEA